MEFVNKKKPHMINICAIEGLVGPWVQ